MTELKIHVIELYETKFQLREPITLQEGDALVFFGGHNISVVRANGEPLRMDASIEGMTKQ